MRRPPAALALLTLASGCGGLQFHNDHRLHFTAPKADSSVSAPVTLSWTMSDLPAAASYGVFVDQAPVRSGHSLTKGTPDVYVTSTPTVTITTFPKPYDTDAGEHQVTVVLLDGSGRRLGESAWRREFKLRGDQA